jgi:NAD-dependent deacetylase
MNRIVFLTGAGMSVESGIPTFRGGDGLWDHEPVMEVCSDVAWQRDPKRVNDFFNRLRRKYMNAEPNEGHRLIASLQDKGWDVQVITQNIDNLHERGGARNVLHLHGEMMRSRSMRSETVSYPINPENPDINMGDKDPYGYQLRPFIVFFGESVPNLSPATEIVRTADVVVVIGTSLAVYPAASLLAYAPRNARIFDIDPADVSNPYGQTITHIRQGASRGMKTLIGMLENSNG